MTFTSLPHLFSALLTTPLATTPFAVDSDGEIIVPITDEVHYALNGEVVEVGSIVVVDTDTCGKQIGRVYTICDNPYYGQSGLCAYVTWLDEDPKQPHWTMYLPLEVVIS